MKLYVYDHCPYCVKARMIFGFKNIDFDLITLLNDDEETPISMIGAKMVPILEKEDGSFMSESLDIIEYIDNLEGTKKVLSDTGSYAQLDDALEDLREYVYKLAMPRWIKAPLEEFKTEGARRYFTNKKEAMIGSFAENIAESKNYIEKVNVILNKLDGIIESDQSVLANLSLDDIHFFASLRSLSIVKGIKYPKKVENYRQNMSNKSKIPLHDHIAI